MTHEELWHALDTLAAEKGLSPSGLARLAGLDPTSFNRSKRAGPAGPRWPGTESLARVLEATGIALGEFATLVAGARVLPTGQARSIAAPRVVAFSSLRGLPPDGTDVLPYAVRLDDARFGPALREGDLVLLHPEAPVGSGDRILAFDGRLAVFCVAERPQPRRMDSGDAFPATIRHRIERIDC